MKHIFTVFLFSLICIPVLFAPDAPEYLAFSRSEFTLSHPVSDSTDQIMPLRHYCANMVQHYASRFRRAFTQQPHAEYLFVVTTDGLRWQELFSGADSSLINDPEITSDPAHFKAKYWAANPEARRKKLMPFFWSTLAANGQVYGNRRYGNKVNVDNQMWFSYPGYNEIFTGFADDRHIWSNSKKQNPNTNVLEYLNRCPGYENRVAAFGSWDAFPYILNEKRAGFIVNAGYENRIEDNVSAAQMHLNAAQHIQDQPFEDHCRTDALTWAFGREYLQSNHPKVMYLGLGETDEYAHLNKYGQYLDAANYVDQCLSELWELIQEDPIYRGKSAILITTDHGRGNQKQWKNHHALLEGSDEIWFALCAPQLQKQGELKTPMQHWQKQLAQTMSNLLGFKFSCEHPVGEPVKAAFKPVQLHASLR
jgi:hypothetical protein